MSETNTRKKPWIARLSFVSTRSIPGPPVVKLHLKLDREPDRMVVLELQLEERRHIQQAIERLTKQLEAGMVSGPCPYLAPPGAQRCARPAGHAGACSTIPDAAPAKAEERAS